MLQFSGVAVCTAFAPKVVCGLSKEDFKQRPLRTDKRPMTRTFLITGGAGFIGSHLTDSLVADGHRVIVLDDLSAGRAENLADSMVSGQVELVRGSVLDAAIVEECVREADVCVHLAARLGVGRIVRHPLDSLRDNVLGVDTVMSVAAQYRRKLIFS